MSLTILGTLLATAITVMAAYTQVNKNVRYRNSLAFYFFIPMVFSAGLVPWYMMCRNLGLVNNFFALLVPTLLFSPFNMFLCRNFMLGIPDSLMESAKLDGAQDYTIAFRIYFPLSMPVIATVALFYGVAYWNDWFNAIMLVSNSKLFPLQYMLYDLMMRSQALAQIASRSGITLERMPTETLKLAMACVATGPIILVYPFVQRYFIKGVTIGSVKG
jgi:putative aldouronate transport system permease protein